MSGQQRLCKGSKAAEKCGGDGWTEGWWDAVASGRDEMGAQGVEGDTQTSEAKQVLRRPRASGEVEDEARARWRAAFGALVKARAASGQSKSRPEGGP